MVLCADPLWWLCYVSVLQSCSAFIPNSQHLHLFVRGLPSGCIRPSFFCMHREQTVPGNWYPHPSLSFWLKTDEYGSINAPAPSPVMGLSVMRPICLQTSLQNSYKVTFCGALLDIPPLFVLVLSLSHVHTALDFSGNTSYLKSPVTVRQTLHSIWRFFSGGHCHAIIPGPAFEEPISEKAISFIFLRVFYLPFLTAYLMDFGLCS